MDKQYCKLTLIYALIVIKINYYIGTAATPTNNQLIVSAHSGAIQNNIEPKIMVLLLVILFVFLFPSNGTSFETPEYSLDQTTLDISAEGTCTSGGVVCKDDLRDDSCTECTNATFLPQYAIDGDRNTEWVSMPSYENPSLTIDLGQV